MSLRAINRAGHGSPGITTDLIDSAVASNKAEGARLADLATTALSSQVVVIAELQLPAPAN